MKKTLTNKRLLYRIVQTSLLQLTLAIMFSSLTMATPVKGQNMLDRKVSVHLTDTSLEKVLLQLEKEAQVKFSFNSRTLKLDRAVSINATNEALSSILNRLLKPLKIKHIQVSNRIVLRKDNDATIGFQEDESTPKSPDFQMVDQTITGTVTDENGTELPGVSILVKGTQRGTTTDANGKYKIDVVNANAILVFSFVGYQVQEVQAGNKSGLDIRLKVDTKALEEVVVVGYGVQKKKDMTGAVSTIGGELFKERRNAGSTVAARYHVGRNRHPKR